MALRLLLSASTTCWALSSSRSATVAQPVASTSTAAVDVTDSVSKTSTLSSSAPPAAIAALVGGHSTAKAAVEAGVDRKEIVKVAMEDGDVMAWLLATIPEYAKEKDGVRGSSRLSRRSLASLSRVFVRLSLPLTPRVCHTRHSCVLCVLPCAGWVPAAPQGR